MRGSRCRAVLAILAIGAAFPVWIAVLLLIAGTAPASAQIKNRACPGDTLLFGLGDQFGCVKPGTNEKVISCFRQPSCSPGWTGAGLPDDTGRDICCPPPPQPKQETLEEMLNRTHPNRTCYWDGEAPFCDGKCSPEYTAGYPSKDGKGMPGGFGKKCITGMKVYCCKFGP